ncbi:cytidylyltransferase domain-containing protein [Viridibacillus arvi]|uniref:acylneuraminate cytidylyltransferase family protein n=1 Tax=Viridibacillus arvi TaxID=263475 RepID=UPI003D00415E
MKPRILAIIPARGGSKGVQRKNVRDLAGKPLIAWTIEEAKKSKYITNLILSSEDPEIIEVAKSYGCDVPFIRPTELAQDDSTSIETVLHAISQCPQYDYVVLLQPTSPFRTVEDIDGCVEQVLQNNSDFCISLTEPAKSPYWMYTLDNKVMRPLIDQKEMVLRRQDLPKVYALNGAVYVAKVKRFIEEQTFFTNDTTGYVMPSKRSLDIDTEIDFKICERLLVSEKKY